MSALGLHNLVRQSVLARKLAVVLVCYLDDSGDDQNNPITTLAGFVAKEDGWRAFETAVEPHFLEYGVRVLHTKDLHHTHGEFKSWKVLKKQFFVNRICRELSSTIVQGITMSVVRGTYKVRAEEYKRKRTITPYSNCFNVILDWVLSGAVAGRLAHEEGVAFILETGHRNNAETEWLFNGIRSTFALESVLRSISFVGKNECRAIQMADLIAFYSRKHVVAQLKAHEKQQPEPQEPMMNLIAGSVPIRSFVATDFGAAAKELPYWRLPTR